jgi:peptidoglycan/LPS O-acetylase OafA/YrhL
LVVPLFLRWPYRCLAVAFVMALAWRFSAQDALGALVDAELALGARWHWSEASVRDMLLHQAPSYLGHFALGIVLGREWLRRRADARAWAARVHLDALLVVAMALFYWVLAIDGRLLGDFTWMLAPLCLGLALFRAALARGSLADRLLARGPLAFMGRISYSAYLYHLPLLLVWHRLAGAMPRALFLPTYLAAVIAVSWLSWRFIERPFLRSDGRRAGV